MLAFYNLLFIVKNITIVVRPIGVRFINRLKQLTNSRTKKK